MDVSAFQALVAELFFDPALRLFPVYLLSTVLIAYVIFRCSNSSLNTSFLGWLVPKRVYFHPSHLVDLKLFVLGRLIDTIGVVNTIGFRTLAAAGTIATLGSVTGGEPTVLPWTTGRVIAVSLTLTLVSDFCVYWVHRWHHEQPVLWPFHAVHHSAEVMTPVTVYRKHPVYDLISDAVISIFIGLAQGILLFCFFEDLSVATIGSVNAAYVIFNLFGSNLRHSHIWIGYGPVFSRIFISPAQHQIHHSRDPRHHNKNYGEIFAIWDWMFKTLYVPRARETLEFGLADSAGNPVKQIHPTLRDALVRPFRDSRAALGRPRRPLESREPKSEQYAP